MATRLEANRWYDPRGSEKKESLRQYREERGGEVAHITRALSRMGRHEVLESERYFPIRFLTDSVDAYIELFDNGVVWYSSLAVELALIVRLGSVIDTWKIRGRRPSFKQLIDRAPDDLLRPRIKVTAHQVRKLRNCYIHYYNIMHDQHIRDRRLMELREKMEPEIGTVMVQSLLDVMEELGTISAEKGLSLVSKRGIPVVQKFVDTEMQQFISERYDKYIKWLSSTKVPEPLRRVTPQEVFKYYGIERFDALSCLKSSFRVLKHLKFV